MSGNANSNSNQEEGSLFFDDLHTVYSGNDVNDELEKVDWGAIFGDDKETGTDTGTVRAAIPINDQGTAQVSLNDQDQFVLFSGNTAPETDPLDAMHIMTDVSQPTFSMPPTDTAEPSASQGVGYSIVNDYEYAKKIDKYFGEACNNVYNELSKIQQQIVTPHDPSVVMARSVQLDQKIKLLITEMKKFIQDYTGEIHAVLNLATTRDHDQALNHRLLELNTALQRWWDTILNHQNAVSTMTSPASSPASSAASSSEVATDKTGKKSIQCFDGRLKSVTITTIKKNPRAPKGPCTLPVRPNIDQVNIPDLLKKLHSRDTASLTWMKNRCKTRFDLLLQQLRSIPCEFRVRDNFPLPHLRGVPVGRIHGIQLKLYIFEAFNRLLLGLLPNGDRLSPFFQVKDDSVLYNDVSKTYCSAVLPSLMDAFVWDKIHNLADEDVKDRRTAYPTYDQMCYFAMWFVGGIDSGNSNCLLTVFDTEIYYQLIDVFYLLGLIAGYHHKDPSKTNFLQNWRKTNHSIRLKFMLPEVVTMQIIKGSKSCFDVEQTGKLTKMDERRTHRDPLYKALAKEFDALKIPYRQEIGNDDVNQYRDKSLKDESTLTKKETEKPQSKKRKRDESESESVSSRSVDLDDTLTSITEILQVCERALTTSNRPKTKEYKESLNKLNNYVNQGKC